MHAEIDVCKKRAIEIATDGTPSFRTRCGSLGSAARRPCALRQHQMEYIWGAAEPEPEPEVAPDPGQQSGQVRAMEEDLMVLLQQLQQAQQAQQELQDELSRAREREEDANGRAEQSYALVSDVQEKFREQIDGIVQEHAAKTEAAAAEAAEARAQLERVQREAAAAGSGAGGAAPAADPEPKDHPLLSKMNLIEGTLAQLEAQLAVETPPGTPMTPMKPLSDSSDEEVSSRLRRLSSTPLKLSRALPAGDTSAAAVVAAVDKAAAAAKEAAQRDSEEAIAALRAELAEAQAARGEAVKAEQVAASKAAEAETRAAEAEADAAAARGAAAAAEAPEAQKAAAAAAEAERAAAATAVTAAAAVAGEEGGKLAALEAQLAAAKTEAAFVKKAADERVAIAMSSAVMAEQGRSELQSELNIQIAQAREEVRKEAAVAQSAAVAAVAMERDDAKAALLLAAKEARDEVAEAQMMQQERVATIEKQLGSAMERAAAAEGRVSALLLQSASDADKMESLKSRLSMAQRQAAILGAKKALEGEDDDATPEPEPANATPSWEQSQDAGDIAMEREAGITNDACHASMKEDMRAFRQNAGSDASLVHWAEESVWARDTGVDIERAMGGKWKELFEEVVLEEAMRDSLL